MKELINKINKTNKYNWDYLKFWLIVKNQFPELVEKILKIHLGKRFNFDNLDKEYYIDISNFIRNNIYNKEKLIISDYEKLYIKIFSPFFSKKDLWFRNKISYNITWLDENWKKIDFYADSKDIQKLLEIIFLKFNNKKKYSFSERLYFITMENLNKIHPFSNNNFWFISIFMDLLLINNNYLPINLKRTFKVNNLFFPKYEIFLEIIYQRYKKYNY